MMRKDFKYDFVPGFSDFLRVNPISNNLFNKIKTVVYNLITVYNGNDVTGVANEVIDNEIEFYEAIQLRNYLDIYFAHFSETVEIVSSLFENDGVYGFEIIVKLFLK